MSYASILVHVHAAPETSARLEQAVSLAKSFDATLIGLAAQMVPPLVPDYGVAAAQGAWLQAMRETVEADLGRAKSAFEAAAAGLSKPTIWESGPQLPGPAIDDAARGADLIVAGAASGWRENAYRDAAAGELVVTSGRPVLIAAEKASATLGERVLLAWKDTREARRAMSAAMPFFKRAEEVVVVEACEGEDLADAGLRVNDVAAALARHGVKAVGKVVDTSPNVDAIIGQAKSVGADLIVAGGYGHSRLGEWVFGGVTRGLLEQRELAVLLSH